MAFIYTYKEEVVVTGNSISFYRMNNYLEYIGVHKFYPFYIKNGIIDAELEDQDIVKFVEDYKKLKIEHLLNLILPLLNDRYYHRQLVHQSYRKLSTITT